MPGPQPAPKPEPPSAAQPSAADSAVAGPGAGEPGVAESAMAQPGVAQPPERARFTSRAAVLAVVLCAIALSLAYPVREYIAQRRQIDQLQAQSAQTKAQLARLNDPAYIEQQARDRLHYCLPRQTCYVIIGGQPARNPGQAAAVAGTPWYERLWSSVQQADRPSSR